MGYCRIHNKIDLDVLSEKLAMETNAAERWIVDLIRGVLLDAKIDSEERCVVMGCGEKNVCQLIMEKMKDLNVRSGVLVGNILVWLWRLGRGGRRLFWMMMMNISFF